MNLKSHIKDTIAESIQVKQSLLADEATVALIGEIAQAIAAALGRGNKIIFCGNGGSFADSQHLVAEFISRFMVDREPLPAVALGTNSSILTATSNDYHYREVFVRELKAVARPDDVLIAISTSGNSENVLRVVEEAQSMGLIVYGLTGESGGILAEKATCLKVPSRHTARIQEAHITIGHILCELGEQAFLP